MQRAIQPLLSRMACGLVLALSAALLPSVVLAATSAHCDESAAGYVQPEIEKGSTVIIFVHGLGGQPVQTWSAGPPLASWPCLLRQDSQFSAVNVYLYGYDTGVLGRHPSIPEVAADMLVRLKPVISRHSDVVFVTHSMGGLVLARMLLAARADPNYEPLLNRVRMVSFYATPGTGADLARLAKLVLEDGERKGFTFKELVDPSLFRSPDADWHHAGFSFGRRCFAETSVVGGWLGSVASWAANAILGSEPLVVSRDSAFALCTDKGRKEIPGADHFSIVKPDTSQHTAYAELSRNFEACVGSRSLRRTTHSLAGNPVAESARLWRERLAERLKEAGSSPEPVLADALFVGAGAKPGSGRYVVPPDHRDGVTSAAHQQGLLTASLLAVQMMQQGTAEALAGRQVEIVDMAFVDEIVFDGALRARLHQLAAEGRLLNGDLAVVLDSDTQPRHVVFLTKGGAPDGEFRLKGYEILGTVQSCPV
jgi:hypothetical protein